MQNLWGFAEEIITHSTLLELKPTKRPFIVARSTFAGAGKYAHHWLGFVFFGRCLPYGQLIALPLETITRLGVTSPFPSKAFSSSNSLESR